MSKPPIMKHSVVGARLRIKFDNLEFFSMRLNLSTRTFRPLNLAAADAYLVTDRCTVSGKSEFLSFHLNFHLPCVAPFRQPYQVGLYVPTQAWGFNTLTAMTIWNYSCRVVMHQYMNLIGWTCKRTLYHSILWSMHTRRGTRHVQTFVHDCMLVVNLSL